MLEVVSNVKRYTFYVFFKQGHLQMPVVSREWRAYTAVQQLVEARLNI